LARYIEPADLLINEDSKRENALRRYGFSILALDCLLIETLQSFSSGLTDSKKQSKEMFRQFLTSRESFRKYFSEEEAVEFYFKFRCGILHQAEVMGTWLLKSTGPMKGKKKDGTPYLNRTKFHEALKLEIDCYCDELRNPVNTDLRRNFKKKMDYIARKELSVRNDIE
jgi:hypothetical protein